MFYTRLSSSPREEGMYWGYNVRYALNLTALLNNCPYEGGYDYMIGSSEHGQIIKPSELSIPKFRHLLIAFGGLVGLEEGLGLDNKLKGSCCTQRRRRPARLLNFLEPQWKGSKRDMAPRRGREGEKRTTTLARRIRRSRTILCALVITHLCLTQDSMKRFGAVGTRLTTPTPIYM